MSEEIVKEPEATQQTEPTPAPAVDEDKLTLSVLEKLKGIFKKEPEEEQGTKTAKAEETGDIDSIIEKRVNEQITKIAAKEKEKVRQSLEDKEQALSQREKDLQMKEKFLEFGIAPQFQDFLKHEVATKGVDLEQYLKDNPQFVQPQTATQIVNTNIKPTLSDKDREYLEFVRSNEN